MAKTPDADRKAREREQVRIRVARQRARAKESASAAPILYSTEDWQLFTDPLKLPQKAGCEPWQLDRVILRELTDNALDSGADDVTIEGDDHHCVIRDNGPGIARDRLALLFSVNRPLVSSKLVRLPTRGMLGNGLRVVVGAVAAFRGTLTVTTRGRKYDLIPDRVTGQTLVRPAGMVPGVAGTTVEVRFPNHPLFDAAAYVYARAAIRYAPRGSRNRDGTAPRRCCG